MDDSNLCLDTDVIIFFLKGREPTATLVEKVVRSYSCHVASVTAYELLFGVARANQEIGEHALLGMMKVLPFDLAVARRAAQLHNNLIRQNKDIGVKDIFIAATCLEHNISLLTLNERHFSRVAGLSLIKPENIPL